MAKKIYLCVCVCVCVCVHARTCENDKYSIIILNEVPRVVKFTVTESKMVVAGDRDMGGCYLMSTVSVHKMEGFRRSVSQ